MYCRVIVFVAFFVVIFEANPVVSNYEGATTVSSTDAPPKVHFPTDKPQNATESYQPSAQSQQIERTINAPIVNASIKVDNGPIIDKTGFRPSLQGPQFEEITYEFNRFPVAPAYSEAKNPGWNFGEYSPPAPPNPVEVRPETTRAQNNWSPQVKFPESHVPTTKEHPYQFYNERRPIGNEKSFGLVANLKKTAKPIMHKNQFDFQAPVRTYEPHYAAELGERPVLGHEMGKMTNPWKKIIKLLTAFIPIGLLISALTPTVINVSPMNGTYVQTKGRAEDVTRGGAKLLDYLSPGGSGCEDRILCELLLSASESQNAEDHVRNLLDAFSKDGKASQRAEDMKKVFDGVRFKDCTPIACRKMQEKT